MTHITYPDSTSGIRVDMSIPVERYFSEPYSQNGHFENIGWRLGNQDINLAYVTQLLGFLPEHK